MRDRHYNGKNALLQEIVIEQKNCVRAKSENPFARQCSLHEAVEAVFTLREQSSERLCSAAFLHDIKEDISLELKRSFHELSEEKYASMRGFFHALRQRRLIQPDSPVELIDLFVRQADILTHHPQLVALYAAAPQKLPQDMLGLLLRDLSGKEQVRENSKNLKYEYSDGLSVNNCRKAI